jgi:hypothetical protein
MYDAQHQCNSIGARMEGLMNPLGPWYRYVNPPSGTQGRSRLLGVGKSCWARFRAKDQGE